jgi:tetratricopeptide (TPR) repeat protein
MGLWGLLQMVVARIITASALLLLLAAASAQLGGDIQAQILYAYHTEDINTLRNLVQELATRVQAGAGDSALRYHLAHAQYRHGLLAGYANAHEAEAAFAECIDQLKPVLAQDVKSEEALILQSACYSGLADHRSLGSGLLRSRSEERLNAALDLAPHNPRAVFLSSMEGLARAKAGSAERQHALAQLQLAVQLFDGTLATNLDTPGWGHAESYLALGRELQSRGDHVGARNWIEKSLIVAPDYKEAQRQLALLVRR